jgi:hypothetical protein
MGNKPPDQKESTKAGILAHNANFRKSGLSASEKQFQNVPTIAEVVEGQQQPKAGESIAVVMPAARMRAHPDLPETDIRPPDFLSPLEAMSDIYMKTRGRMSNKTKDLLSGTDLEDLLNMIGTLHTNEQLVRKSEARIKAAIWTQLKDDPGPLLLGLNDKRLTEPWRLFIDRWDIWTPEDSVENGGVELFWEGEGEDDEGEAIEILEALKFQKGELSLYVRLGTLEDKLTFDGEAFYRL